MATKKTTVTLESLFEQPVIAPTGIGSTTVNSSPSNPAEEATVHLTPEALAPHLMSVKEAAATLGLSLSSISHHVSKGHIKGLTVGTASILFRWSVEEFQAGRAVTRVEDEEAKALRARLKELKTKRQGLKVH